MRRNHLVASGTLFGISLGVNELKFDRNLTPHSLTQLMNIFGSEIHLLPQCAEGKSQHYHVSLTNQKQKKEFITIISNENDL